MKVAGTEKVFFLTRNLLMIAAVDMVRENDFVGAHVHMNALIKKKNTGILHLFNYNLLHSLWTKQASGFIGFFMVYSF